MKQNLSIPKVSGKKMPAKELEFVNRSVMTETDVAESTVKLSSVKLLSLYLPPAVLKTLNSYLKKTVGAPSRSQFISNLIIEFFEKKGISINNDAVCENKDKEGKNE